MNLAGRTIHELHVALRKGETTSRALTEAALEAISADGRAFTHVNFAGARAAADAADARIERSEIQSPLAGLPISVKDLFDVAGEITTAGSSLLRRAAEATGDAPVVTRLRKAGAIVTARTQMSEFAFTGLGVNPHWPELPNPRDEARVPGGSSSGAGVAVARGQSIASLGTDTGGSVRIPAAFCGVTGFKPTQRRITRAGAFPLSPSLDSIGPLANSVECCRLFDAGIADVPLEVHPPIQLRGLRFAVPLDYVLDEIDEKVGTAFDAALERLSNAGATIERFRFPEFARVPQINGKGALANAEAFEVHRDAGLLAFRDKYDPNVIARIEIGQRMSSDDVGNVRAARTALIEEANAHTRAFDGLLFPTVAIVAPRFSDITAPDAFARANSLALRNAGLVNFIDRCALSLPMQGDGELPCGLMIVGETMGDARLLAIGQAVERALRKRP